MELVALSRSQQESSRRAVIAGVAFIVVCYVGWRVAESQHLPALAAHAADQALHITHADAAEAAHVHSHGPAPSVFSVIPFAVLLLCVAFLPLFHSTAHWWEGNWNRLLVAAGLGLVTLLYYAFCFGHGVVDHMTHQVSSPGIGAAVAVFKNSLLIEYTPFIVLLFSLYVISGGICIEGNLVGRPKVNSTIIGVGALLASLIGTTGAAMVLVRPLLRANARRQHVAHTVVFFIFVVCNTGGCLLPIGDPPLFLGFLRGVNFFWTLSLWPMWLFMNVALISVYFIWDSIRYRSEDKAAIEASGEAPQRFAILGGLNALWLVGVIACVALLDPSKPVPGTDWRAPLYYREIVMLGFTALSLWTTAPAVREKNAFNYDAILEVAALFSGIFICMQAPIQLLNAHGPSLGFDEPWKFYWGTGLLSSFLDNAPTYVVFFETAKTMPLEGAKVAGVLVPFLTAVSLGAVFMGAMTYIGNGPNFMVKAIAEKNRVRMPSFFGYMGYSCAVLLPLSLLLNLIFFAASAATSSEHHVVDMQQTVAQANEDPATTALPAGTHHAP